MAEIYVICEAGGSTTASVEMTQSSESANYYYTQNDCDYTVRTKTVTFTLSQPSTQEVTIWYRYDYTLEENGVIIINNQSTTRTTTVDAGQTSHSIEVETYRRSRCKEEPDPYDDSQQFLAPEL